MLVLKWLGIWVKEPAEFVPHARVKANKSTTVPVHTINVYEGLKIELHSFSSLALYAVSDHVHGPAVLSPRIQPPISSH